LNNGASLGGPIWDKTMKNCSPFSRTGLRSVLACLFTITVWGTAVSQTEIIGDGVCQSLAQELSSQLGRTYEVGYYDLDSLIGKRVSRPMVQTEVIQDPYGTLKENLLFSAWPVDEDGSLVEERVVLGFAKGNQILWKTDPVIGGHWNLLWGADDLNYDGRVDVIVTFNYTDRLRIDYVWILSWNGRTGEFLNPFDASTGQSGIVTTDGILEMVHGKRASALRAYWDLSDEDIAGFFPKDLPPTIPYVTYAWNGSFYTVEPASGQIPASQFLPANQLKVQVHAHVSAQASTFRFRYAFANERSSAQNVVKIAIPFYALISSPTSPGDWVATSSMYGLTGIFWGLPPRFPGSPNSSQDMIVSGNRAEGFGFESEELPAICRILFQGDRNMSAEAQLTRSQDDFQRDLLHNSFSTFTVGPANAGDSFNELILLDTLLSYTRQSADLGWLGRDRDNDCDNDERPDDGVVKNIEKRLGKAKRFLERDDSVKARKELEKLVQKVERIWKRSQDQEKKRGRDREWKQDKSLMTSEAYVLLKYNAEYLIDRLPERQSHRPKKKERE